VRFDTSMFIEDDNAHGGLFVARASLSQSFFDELKKHPVPVEGAAVRQIVNNSLALDVYCWLAYHLHSLNAPITISWKALHGQFGRSVARLDHFKDHFRTVLALATSVYPEADVEESGTGSGLILKPSKAPVASRERCQEAAVDLGFGLPIKISTLEKIRFYGESWGSGSR
jgi:hypothetical protein